MDLCFSYTVRQSGAVSVFLTGCGCVGHIMKNPAGGYYYRPKGSRTHGDTFSSIEQVKQSIERGDT